MNFRTLSMIQGIALLVVAPLVAQETAGTDHVGAIKQSLETSMQALHGYTWVETTVISIKGEEKSRTESSCSYSADGQVEKTPIPGQTSDESKKPRGLRGRIAERKKAEITDSMQQAIALVKQYVPPDAAKIQAAKEQGDLSVVPPDERGNVQVTIKDYLKSGDSITIEANAATNRLTGMSVATYVDSAKDAVGLEVAFEVFTDGTTIYPATVDLTVASQHLEVAITNSGYQKLGG
jgi:hypothetical protein